jgi:uncharacterized protein
MTSYDFLLSEFQERPLPRLTPRSVVLPEVARKPNVVIGMRRTGKTFLLYQEMQRLLEAGTDKRDVLYVNFEDDRLHPLAPNILGELLEAFYRSNPDARERRAFLFFDEIQVVPDFGRFVRRVIDTENARIFLTGSSAKLLHSEVATELRGRSLVTEVFPFSFAESARNAGIEPPRSLPPGSRLRSRLSAHGDRYLEAGGFPEVQEMALTERVQTLQDYVELVLLRDVIERHRVENPTASRAFLRALLQSSGRSFSVNKVHGDLRSRGLQVSKDTLHALLDHFEDAFLVHTVPIFKRSERARASNPRKVYAIDPGLAWAMSHATAIDLGARLETAVFLELRRRHGRLLQGQISYYRTSSDREIDFVVGDLFSRQATRLVQTCASLAEAGTREREVKALSEGMKELGLATAEIVTLNQAENIAVESGTIRVVPAWQWMLETPAG